MTAYEKPDLSVREVEHFLQNRYGGTVDSISHVTGGNLSRVFFFDVNGHGRVIRFSDLPDAFAFQHEMSNLLCSQGIKYQRFLEKGTLGSLSYSIAERIEGSMLADAPEPAKRGLLPELAQVITQLNLADVRDSHGFGWVRASGSGDYASWSAYIADFYGEDQTGTFWENWTGLFRTSCLEKDVFDECYTRLTSYMAYNEPFRYLVHNDSHPWNILTDGRTITGIIDGNFVFGDFLIDLAIVERSLPYLPVIDTFRAHYEGIGLEVPHFHERLLGAYYYKGLDALRFYAKMGWTAAYEDTRNFLLQLAK